MSGPLVADAVGDAPLGATRRALAAHRAEDLLHGLGLLAVARGARKLAVRVADPAAEAALREAAARLGAQVAIERGDDSYPAPPGGVSAAALVALADEARRRPPQRFVTVAGAVAAPVVLAVNEGAPVRALVEVAGGAAAPDWVAVAGGAPGGRLVDRDAPVDDELLLVLPAGHAWVRRLRTPVGDWLRRAASACAACSACSALCPAPGLSPHGLIRSLVALRDDGRAPAHALACTRCGLCDAVCPASLSPRALVEDVAARLRAGGFVTPPEGAAPKAPAAVSRALLALRYGLTRWDRPPAIRL